MENNQLNLSELIESQAVLLNPGTMMYFLNQFGILLGMGWWYLYFILKCYMQNEGCLDITQCLEQVCKERNVMPKSVKSAIHRFLVKSWSLGLGPRWINLTAWNQDTPPRPMQAICLICDGYPVFVRQRQSMPK